jgi:hypothetical protein
MKKLNLFWKIVIVCVTIGILIYSYNKIQRYYHFHNDVYGSYSISDNCDVVSFLNDDKRIRLKSNRSYTTPRFTWIANPMQNDSLTVFIKDGKRGFLNVNTGKIVIPAKYQLAWLFSEGLAAVMDNYRIGFINPKGELVIGFKYPYHPNNEITMDFIFKKGFCAVKDSSGKTGIINKQEQWILQPSFDYIKTPVKNYRVVINGKYFGVIDSAFNIVFPVKYDNVKVRNDGFLLAFNYTQQLVGFDCKTVLIPFVYDNVHILFYNTEYNGSGDNDIYKRTEYTAFEINGKKGIINPKGKVIVPAMYDGISALSPELFTCQTGDEWITVNGNGEKVK